MDKLLTLNTHSYMEDCRAIDRLATGISDEVPDIIALQEVNQTQTAQMICDQRLDNYMPVSPGLIKEDNYALVLGNKLIKVYGLRYYWSWLPIKLSYGSFDEGIAVLSRFPIEETDSILLSKTNDYSDWKKRMALGVKVKQQWFYSVHLGWFDDVEEPFEAQWHKLNETVCKKKDVWLMGDFNNTAYGDGYKVVINSGWVDCYESAKDKDDGFTVTKSIDGWRKQKQKIRIDYIFKNSPQTVKSAYTIFNGRNKEEVSDHSGVIVTL